MKRAQIIREKHIKKRRKNTIKSNVTIFKRKKEATILFNWVLDLFEDPYECGRDDEIVLCKFGTRNIAVGYYSEGNVVPGKIFDDRVMKKLVTMFHKEKGFSAVYIPYDFIEKCAKVIIKIE